MATTFRYGANVHANGIRQHYLRYGAQRTDQQDQHNQHDERDAVIIIPGITSPAATWGFVGERFGRRFDTYVLDVRGRGLSEASDTLDYGIDALADDVIGFAQALGLRRYALVGHSMGARIAARAARCQPQKLSRVVLVDPPVSGPGRRPYPATLDWYLDSMRDARAGMGVEAMRKYCPTWTIEQLRLRAEWLHSCDERAVVASFEGFHSDDFHADLQDVTVPALLVVAGRGDVVRPDDVDDMRRQLPGLQVSRVEAAGHMIPWDDEEGFYRAFGSFLGAPVHT
jgi:N-formylmaleamate deformylase